MKVMTDLPPELLLLVCSALQTESVSPGSRSRPEIQKMWQARQALARLSQTCRMLRAVAQPVLFRAFPPVHGRRAAGLFLRSTLENPSLALAVRSLFTIDRNDYRLPSGEPFPAAARALAARLPSTWTQPSPGSADRPGVLADAWTNMAAKGETGAKVENFDRGYSPSSGDAMLAFFLAVLPNLEHAALWWLSPATATAQLPAAADYLPGLSKLRDLNAHCHFPSVGVHLDGVAAWLALPSLRRFAARNIQGERACAALAARSCHITAINLMGSAMTREGLASLVAACKELKSLTFAAVSLSVSWECRAVAAGPRELVDALRCQAASLRRLRADFDGFFQRRAYAPDGRDAPWVTTELVMPSLNAFVALEVLVLRQNCLLEEREELDPFDDRDFLVEFLPSSIRRFTLLDVDEDFSTVAIARLAVVARQEFPRLELVEVEPSDLDLLEDYQNLIPTFEQAAINYKVRGSSQQ